MRLNILILNILKIICLCYIIVGIIVWFNCFEDTNYNIINIPKQLVGEDGHTSDVWVEHDKIWSIYETYSMPFWIITIPIYLVLGIFVSGGKISFMLYDIFNLYLLLVPVLLLWLGVFITRKIKLFINQKGY